MTGKGKIVALMNQKGGVGKSTTGVNLSHYAHRFRKYRTCVLDTDAQANSSRTLATEWPKDALVGSDFFKEKLPAGRKPITTKFGIDLIPGDARLKAVDSKVDYDDVSAKRQFFQNFRRNVQALRDEYGYELIIIDTPTTAEMRYLAALVAADFSVTPAVMDAYSLDGASELMQSLQSVKAQYGNPRHKHLGILPNLVKAGSKLHEENLGNLQAAGVKVLPVTLIYRVAVQATLNGGRPVWDGGEDGVKNYKAIREWRAACDLILNEVFQ